MLLCEPGESRCCKITAKQNEGYGLCAHKENSSTTVINKWNIAEKYKIRHDQTAVTTSSHIQHLIKV